MEGREGQRQEQLDDFRGLKKKRTEENKVGGGWDVRGRNGVRESGNNGETE